MFSMYMTTALRRAVELKLDRMDLRLAIKRTTWQPKRYTRQRPKFVRTPYYE